MEGIVFTKARKQVREPSILEEFKEISLVVVKRSVGKGNKTRKASKDQILKGIMCLSEECGLHPESCWGAPEEFSPIRALSCDSGALSGGVEAGETRQGDQFQSC